MLFRVVNGLYLRRVQLTTLLSPLSTNAGSRISHQHRIAQNEWTVFSFFPLLSKRLCDPFHCFTHRGCLTRHLGPDFDPKIYAFLNNQAFPLILTTGKSRSSIPSLIEAGEYLCCLSLVPDRFHIQVSYKIA